MKNKLKIFTIVVLIISIGHSIVKADEKKVVSIGMPADESVIISEVQEGGVETYLNNAGFKMDLEVGGDALISCEAVAEGSIDLNFRIHEDFMQQFNNDRNADLVRVGDYLYEQVTGLYSHKINDISEFKNGDIITIQNDPVNRDRALKILHDSGLITLDPNIPEGSPASLANIVKNDLNLEFYEVPAQTLVASMEDTTAAILRGTIIKQAGFRGEDALAFYERKDVEKYAMILVAKKGNENTEWAKAVHEGLKSKETREKIDEVTGGTWIPLFDVED